MAPLQGAPPKQVVPFPPEDLMKPGAEQFGVPNPAGAFHGGCEALLDKILRFGIGRGQSLRGGAQAVGIPAETRLVGHPLALHRSVLATST